MSVNFSNPQFLFAVGLVVTTVVLYRFVALIILQYRSKRILRRLDDIDEHHQKHMLEIEKRLENLERPPVQVVTHTNPVVPEVLDRNYTVARGQALAMLVRSSVAVRRLGDGRS